MKLMMKVKTMHWSIYQRSGGEDEEIGVSSLSKQGNDSHVKALNLTWKTKQCAGLPTILFKSRFLSPSE
jgi:hypothetical protein